jgi:hypothetical protein
MLHWSEEIGTMHQNKSSTALLESLEARTLFAVGMDAAGWTVVTPSADSRIIYVSSSSGNDNNSGLSGDAPVESLYKAYSLVRDDYPDWILLKRGDAWTGGLNIQKDGRSADQPLLLSAYGESGERPIVLNGKIYIEANNIAVIGLHLQGPGKTANPTGEGIETSYNVTRSNILLEDLRIEGHKLGLNTRHASQLTLRRSIIKDNAVQGLYTNTNVDVLVEENTFDNNGTDEIMDHNIYKGGNTTNFTIRWNIIARGANFGVKWRAPADTGLVYENIFVGNRNDMSIGLDNENSQDLRTSDIQVIGNVFVNTGRNNQQQALGMNHVVNALVSNNIFTNSDHMTQANLITLASQFENAPINLQNIDIVDNIISNVSTNGLRVITGNYKDVTFRSNTVQLMTKRISVFRGRYDADEFSIGDNTYYTAAPVDEWFDYVGSDISWAQWQELTNDNSVIQNVAFPDADRTLATYNASRGKNASLEAFLAEVLQQSPAYWRPEYTTQAVIDYVREGFGLAPITQILVTPLSAPVTTEGGGTANYQITLSRQPSGNVTIPVSSSDTSEGTVSVTSLMFTPDNWNIPQIITIAGVDDAIVDGDRTYSLVLGAAESTDTRFAGLDPADVALTNVNDEPDTTPPDVAMNYGGSIKMIRSSSVLDKPGYRFSVVYTDDAGINSTSLKTGNLLMTGPDGYNQLPAFISSKVQDDGSVLANYRFSPPGGTWDQGDNGFYRLKTGPTPANDFGGNAAVAGTTGTMIVYIDPEPDLPLMSVALAANAVTNTTVLNTSSAYKFTVTYLPDQYAMKSGSIGTGDVKVINNKGYIAKATLVSKKSRSQGSIVAKYRIVPPGGTWDTSDNTVYKIVLRKGQVRDMEGNYVPAGKLGKFRVDVLPSGGRVVITPEFEDYTAESGLSAYASPTKELFNSEERILDTN